MAKVCIGIPVPPFPTLPAGFSFPSIPLPPVPNLDLCCQFHLEDYLPPIPPIPWPGGVNVGVLQAINAVMLAAQIAVQAYVDSLVPECPKIPRST